MGLRRTLYPAIAMTGAVWGFYSTTGCSAAAEDDLPNMARAAARAFRPLTQADVQEAKASLIDAAGRLDARLAQDGENGRAWRAYLKFDGLQAQLKAAQPDLAELDKIFQKFNAGHSALGLVWFADVRSALWHYVGVARGIGSSKLQAGYEKVLDNLAKRIETYSKAPNADDAFTISSTIAWLENARQAKDLLAAMRQKLQHENFFLDLSPATIDALIALDLDEDTPVNSMIAGAHVVGTGRTTGHVRGQLVPDADRAVIDAIFEGRSDTRTVGRKGPAQVYASGITSLAGVTRLWIDAEGVHSLPASSNAVTSTTITGVAVSCNCGAVQRMAQKQANKKLGQAEYTGARLAERQLNERMNQQARDMIARNNEEFDQRVRTPLTERKVFPTLRFASTSSWASVRGLAANSGQLAASADPPACTAGRDLNLRLHESAVNNMMSSALSGMIVHDEEFQATVKQLLGELPDGFKPDPDEEPWAITFADQQPISMSIGDDHFRVTLRGKQFYRGGAPFPGMNVSANYKIVRNGNEVKAVRQGAIEVLPPNYKPGTQLSGRETTIRKMLEKRFNKIFREELQGTDLTFTGSMARLGTFTPTHLASKNGWLAVAMKRSATKPATARPATKK